MNRLDELMDYYQLKDEKAIEEMPIDEDEKQRILHAVLEKAGLQEKEIVKTYSKNIRKRRLGILLAACISVFAMGAVGFAAVSLNGGMLSFFNPKSQEETELLNSIGMIIDKQVSANGLTIDVKEAVGDSNAVYVMFDIIAPEGMVLDKEQYTFVTNNIQIGGAIGSYGMGYSFQELEDANKTDNRIPMMLCLSSSKKLVGENMTISFEDFSTYKTEEEMATIPQMTEPGTAGDENDWYHILIQGEWKITFPLNYKDNSLCWNVNQKISYKDMEVNVKQIRLSPISINMTLNNLDLKHHDVMEAPWLIHMKNGDVIDLNKCGRGAYTGSLKGTIIDAQFDQIVRLEDVESIEFCGTIIPVKI
ncbi:DUF4179 domain-containing protein [Clostridium aminobutyricum]|uniref:DUF4179 domain-containing protein n=1 Tax=Clostridium aminobutyricum TaxID=33953 RepID=A0A939D614_CLOAM|nr:DUF4179 domain-containing protein [Clostridium aminobutyricum]MBN7772024.1 DUF4179 domain-containing protein [Clostridium aminobutyricum]